MESIFTLNDNCLRRIQGTVEHVITCPVTKPLNYPQHMSLVTMLVALLRPHNAAVRGPFSLWRRQSLTSQEPLAS